MSPGLTRILLALTFVTGIVDAVTFLGLGQVFAAMQTGNVIFLGLGIGGAAGAPFIAPFVGLLAFVAGSGLAALLARAARARGTTSPSLLGPALAIEVVLLGTAALIALIVDVTAGATSAYALIALLAVAMGMRNTTVRVLGGSNLATTVLNLTVTGLAAAAPLGVASGGDLEARGAALTALLAGAVAGALLVKTSLALPIGTAAAVTFAAALAHRRRTAVPIR